ncbi:MAG: hypothetical protein K9H64_23245 [Bacteroidales bacterium]|nr:hypothetical protein [Bacteroidales bacterium]MCF8458936.1 hypothetical protein [Bacteroidales bacterium]
MKRNIIYLLFLVMAPAFIISCGKDEDKPAYTFLDQEMQGKIGGDDWTLVTGSADIDHWDSTLLSLDFYGVEITDPCNYYQPAGNKVICSVPNQVGLYELNFDLSSDNIQTVTLYHRASELNNAAIEGAIEITLIDTTNGLVQGRIDAKIDSEYFVNGNFTLIYCE